MAQDGTNRDPNRLGGAWNALGVFGVAVGCLSYVAVALVDCGTGMAKSTEELVAIVAMSYSWMLILCCGWTVFVKHPVGSWRIPLVALAATGFAFLILAYAALYVACGVVDVSNGSLVVHSPSMCLYFSVECLTRFGSGDFAATPEARWIAMSEATFGPATMALVVGIYGKLLGAAIADVKGGAD